MRLALDPPIDPAVYPFVHRVRVRFAETDAMGIVHHAAYLPYLEEARVSWLRSMGHPYTETRADGVDFSVVEAWVRYRKPLRFDDVVDVHVGMGARTPTTFQLGYLLRVDDTACATGVTVHGAVTTAGRPTRLPAWMAEIDLASI